MALAVTAMTCARTLFFFFNDPEGPNLLIVIALGLVVFLISWAAYQFIPSKIYGVIRLLAAVCFQILLVICLYFAMK